MHVQTQVAQTFPLFLLLYISSLTKLQEYLRNISKATPNSTALNGTLSTTSIPWSYTIMEAMTICSIMTPLYNEFKYHGRSTTNILVVLGRHLFRRGNYIYVLINSKMPRPSHKIDDDDFDEDTGIEMAEDSEIKADHDMKRQSRSSEESLAGRKRVVFTARAAS